MKIRNKLILFSVFIILITTMATLTGSIILSINQTKRQNHARLKNALVNMINRINSHLVKFDSSISYHLHKKDLIYAGSLSVSQGQSYFLVSLAGTDFLSFATEADLDAFAFYSAPGLKGPEKLRLYYSIRFPECNTTLSMGYVESGKEKDGLFIVDLADNRHLCFKAGGIFSRMEKENLNLFPLEYKPGKQYYLEKRGSALVLVYHYDLKAPKEGTEFVEGTHLGYLVLEKELKIDLEGLASDLGIEMVIYTPDGMFGRGSLEMPNLEPKSHTYTEDDLLTLADLSDQKYDSVIVPLVHKNIKYGFFSASISQEETERQVVEYITLLLKIGGGILILVIIISFGIVNRGTRPIITLSHASKAIAEGNLEYPIPTQGYDELSILAKSFSNMRDAIREKIELIVDQKNSLEANLKIIEQKNQELQELDRLKDEFLAKTSHELRSPLHGIVGIAEAMLLSDPKNTLEKERSHISMIISNGRRLHKLINDLLDFYKIREFGIKINLEPIALKSMVDAIMAFCQQLVGRKSLILRNEISPDLPKVLADKSRLEQVFYNLIDNAIKFTESGEISVSANLMDDNEVQISVNDTGIGVPEKQQDKIFHIFSQGNEKISTTYQGTGLGLSITKSLLELHESQLKLSSIESKGSSFFFTLKIASEAELAAMSPKGSGMLIGDITDVNLEKSETSTNNQIVAEDTVFQPGMPDEFDKDIYRIMVIDDEPVNLETLRICLSHDNYRVDLETDGETALQNMQANPPDLVLLDLMMPGMNGFEVCRRIREQWDLVTLPVIILSAKSRLKDLERGFQVGANDYLIKPFQPKEILIRVHTHLLAKTAVEHLREKQILQEEVAFREKLEIELRATQKTLFGILNEEEDAIICSNSEDRIIFFNRGAEKMLGYPSDHVVGKERSTLFPEQPSLSYINSDSEEQNKEFCNLKIQKANGEIIPVSSYSSSHSVGNERLTTLFIPSNVGAKIEMNNVNGDNNDPAGGESQNKLERDELVQLQKRFLQNQDRIISLEKTLSDLLCDTKFTPANEGNDTLRKRPNDNEDDGCLDGNVEHFNAAQEQSRRAVVDLMCLSLEIWEMSTKKGKLDLAKESNIWHVNIENDCYEKTRTLDRYLNLKTLPSKPRIREVIRTANFVLEHTKSESHKIRLEAALLHLRSSSQ